MKTPIPLRSLPAQLSDRVDLVAAESLVTAKAVREASVAVEGAARSVDALVTTLMVIGVGCALAYAVCVLLDAVAGTQYVRRT